MLSLFKTCPNITANIADSILAMVTDALASIYVIAHLNMDGRSSIFITKPGNTQEHLCQFTCYKKESFSRKTLDTGKTESLRPCDVPPYISLSVLQDKIVRHLLMSWKLLLLSRKFLKHD